MEMEWDEVKVRGEGRRWEGGEERGRRGGGEGEEREGGGGGRREQKKWRDGYRVVAGEGRSDVRGRDVSK